MSDDHRLSTPLDAELLTALLEERFLGLPPYAPRQAIQLGSYVEALCRFGYATAADLARVLDRTERARSVIQEERNGLMPDSGLSALYEAIALADGQFASTFFEKMVDQIDRYADLVDAELRP